MKVNIKIDTENKEILILEKISIDDLSLFLTGLKDMIDLSEFSISCEPIKVKEYITIKEKSGGLIDPLITPYYGPNPFTTTC